MPKVLKSESNGNGHAHPMALDQLGLARLTACIHNSVLTQRREWIERLNPDRRNIDNECGYDATIALQDYKLSYDREGVGRRVVQLLPIESWAMDPEVYEVESVERLTRFERAWRDLLEEQNVLHYLERIDILSGIGEFGVLLFGFDDGRPLDSALYEVDEFGRAQPTGKKLNLLYLRCFDQTVAEIDTWDEDETSARHGQPIFYQLTLREGYARKVHWTRTLHVADLRESCEVLATPRQQPVWNRLHDLRKIYGGAGEGIWKGGFPGYSFEVDPEVEFGETEQAAFKDELFRYFEGMQRAISTQGVKAKSLGLQVADPSKHIEANLQNIALTLGVPYPTFIGSEDSKLTSQQSAKTWTKRLAHRQSRYLSPMLLRPFVQRLIDVGALPSPPKGFKTSWPDLNSPSGHEKAQVTKLLVDAMAKYMQQAVFKLFPPMEFLTRILGFNVEEAELILKDAVDLIAEEEEAKKLLEEQAKAKISKDMGEDRHTSRDSVRGSESLNQVDTDGSEVSTVQGK